MAESRPPRAPSRCRGLVLPPPTLSPGLQKLLASPHGRSPRARRPPPGRAGPGLPRGTGSPTPVTGSAGPTVLFSDAVGGERGCPLPRGGNRVQSGSKTSRGLGKPREPPSAKRRGVTRGRSPLPSGGPAEAPWGWPDPEWTARACLADVALSRPIPSGHAWSLPSVGSASAVTQGRSRIPPALGSTPGSGR